MKRLSDVPVGLSALLCVLCFALPPAGHAADSAAGAVPAAPADDEGDELRALLVRFDEVQNQVRTLSAALTMTTVNPLLKDPVVCSGHVYMTKPDAVRWEFDTPEEMRFVIANDEYLGYYPAQKRAERKNIRRWSEQLFRYFGLGQGSDELRKFYRIELRDSENDLDGTHLLVLHPRKRRARKRVDDVRFWIDAKTLLPVRVEYTGAEGSSRTVEFRNMQVNVEVASGLYRFDLPPDVSVTTAFTPFGGS